MLRRLAGWVAAVGLAGLAVGCGGDAAFGPASEDQSFALPAAGKAIVSRQAVVTATVTDGGVPMVGARVRFGRSVSGRAVDYTWSGTTDAEGTAVVDIAVDSASPFGRLGAGGYYQARAEDAVTGEVMGEWNSIPIRGGVDSEVSLPIGGRADVSGTQAIGDRTLFTVRIENVGQVYPLAASGAFNTPSGASAPGPLTPGGAYEFEFQAPPGSRLSFATMFVHSNDFFYAPNEAGVALWDESGDPVSGDITDQILLWDSGTEINQEPGTGADQAPRQAGANTGAVDPDGTVRLAPDTFTNLPAVDDVIQVTSTPLGEGRFRIRIENISSETALSTTGGDLAAVLAPGVYAIHTAPGPLFTSGEADAGDGLEDLAEDGDPSGLAAALAARTGLTAPLAPGVWAVHASGMPIFAVGQPDAGAGLEALAEDGNPAGLAASLGANAAVVSSGVFNTPEGASGPGALLPGSSYVFTFSAEPGERLSFATMFVPSNDTFFGPDSDGLALWDGGEPISGDITAMTQLWDAGTEADQPVGFGSDQAPYQSGADTGDADPNGTVRAASAGFPAVGDVIQVTITPGS